MASIRHLARTIQSYRTIAFCKTLTPSIPPLRRRTYLVGTMVVIVVGMVVRW
uniref:Uncharacterized protein n=1 Tax=Helianthus annuus TaxID=4232 RepID=A0A251S5P2_HELAN